MSKSIHFFRPPVEIARYTALNHPKDSANPINPRRAKAVNMQPEQYVRDGLNTSLYSVMARHEYPLYTWIHAILNSECHLTITSHNHVITPSHNHMV